MLALRTIACSMSKGHTTVYRLVMPRLYVLIRLSDVMEKRVSACPPKVAVRLGPKSQILG
jgi:hypothetical protein